MEPALNNDNDNISQYGDLVKSVYHQTFLSRPNFASMDPAEDIFIAVYITIGITGFLSNLVIIINELRSSSLNFFPYNLLLINLFISNILMSLICVPFTLMTLIRSSWTYGLLLCKLIPALQGIGVCVHATAITVAAIVRYLDVLNRRRPFNGVYYSNFSRVCLGSAIIWILGIVIGSPHAYYQTYRSHEYNVTIGTNGGIEYNPTVLYTCTEAWNPITRSVYTLIMFTCESLVPTFVLIYTSFAIKESSLDSSDSSNDSRGRASRQSNHILRDNSVNKTLIIVTTSFAVCWIPFNILNVMIDLQILSAEIMNSADIYFIIAIFHTIAMVSAPLSAIVYGYFTPTIRRNLFGFCRRRSNRAERAEQMDMSQNCEEKV